MDGYNVTKNIKKRLPIWLIGFLILLFIDEYIKEGYLFKPSDIFKPLTHENIIVIITIALIITLIYNRFINR